MEGYSIDEVEIEDADWRFNVGDGRFTKEGVDQPRQSPIRRKDKMKLEEGLKPKVKRDHRKIQQRIKYELYEAAHQVGKNELS
jgi:hypothetical protein